MNLLIALKSLNAAPPVPQAMLLNAHAGAKPGAALGERRNYFEIMSLLYYIGHSSSYPELMAAIRADIEKIALEAEAPDGNTEATLLLFDVISCPYLSADFKKIITRTAMHRILGGQPSDAQINEVINYSFNNISFFDWRAQPNLERLLQKKELTLAY